VYVTGFERGCGRSASGRHDRLIDLRQALDGGVAAGAILGPVKIAEQRAAENIVPRASILPGVETPVHLRCTGDLRLTRQIRRSWTIFSARAVPLFLPAKDRPGRHASIQGLAQIDKAIVIDQTPIGRTPAQNQSHTPALSAADRDLFAGLSLLARAAATIPAFLVQCERRALRNLRGDGVKKIEMHFPRTFYVECEFCRGRRYNRETRRGHLQSKKHRRCLDMTVGRKAGPLLPQCPQISDKLLALEAVGPSARAAWPKWHHAFRRRGPAHQSSPRSSRGKSHRPHRIHLDEPTTGLHFADIHSSWKVRHEAARFRQHLIIIEHNLEVI